MFFIETREVENSDGVVETWGVIHFVLGVSACLCKCYYDVDEGKTDPAAWSEPFPHYYEAAGEVEAPDSGMKLGRCSNCFDSMMIKTGGPVKLNVLVFAEGCVDPDILVTFDEDVARKWYLEKELKLTEDDLLSWQDVSITMPMEKQVL